LSTPANLFALVDCNNFYVSCERLFQPKLRDRAVVVLSNLDGCVVSRSNEAKALGIGMAVPVYQVKNIIEKNNVVLLSSNYALYGDMSRRVMMTLQAMSSEMEIYSIDEAFLNLKGHNGSLNKFGRTIKDTIYQHTGIPVSVGIAATKTLAKTANYIAKKSVKAAGVLDLTNPRHVEKALERTPIGNVWGIGRQHSKMLRANMVETALQFTNLPEDWLQRRMGINGVRLRKELLGIACADLDHKPAPQKSALCSRSFGKQVESLGEMKEAVATFLSRAAEKIRQRNLMTRAVTVFMITNRHREDQAQTSISEVEHLTYPSNSTQELLHVALDVTERAFREGFRFKKAGVILAPLVPATPNTIRIFDEEESQRQQKAMTVLDEMNSRYGRDTLRFAITGMDGQDWKHRVQHRSPCYTTRWDQLLNV
jgi:DNA polymerase V